MKIYIGPPPDRLICKIHTRFMNRRYGYLGWHSNITPLEKFLEEQMKTDCDIVGLSALMTTSMVAMPEIVKKLKEKNPNVRIMLGGAPITPELVDTYGADGYAESAGTAVDEAIKLIKMLKEEEMK